MKHKHCYFCLIMTISFFTTLMTGCNNSQSNSGDQNVIVKVQSTSVLYYSVSELVEHSDLIVIAKIVEPIERVNLARRADKPDEPDPNYYSIGQIYRVEIDEWLKGKSESTIYLAKSLGAISTISRTPTIDEIEKAVQDSGELLPNLSKRYLLFLSQSKHAYKGYTLDRTFTPIGHPWLFDLTDSKCVHFEDQYLDLGKFFPIRSLDQIEQVIQDPIQGKKFEAANTYPSPEVEAYCHSSDLYTYPSPSFQEAYPARQP